MDEGAIRRSLTVEEFLESLERGGHIGAAKADSEMIARMLEA
jgi:hypothetical protein